MRLLLTIANAIVDSCFAWFTPGWRRKGTAGLSALTRFLNHYRPKIKEERLAELTSLQTKLREALLNWKKEDTLHLTAELDGVENAHPLYKRNAVAEMVESFFVVMVVFMGIRTYYIQPFRIPTGSMQPTLNGIIIHPFEGDMPAAPQRWWNALTLGSSYVDETATNEKTIVRINQRQKWLFLTETVLSFDDGSTLSIPCAQGAVIQYFRDRGKLRSTPFGIQFLPFRQGESIIRARIDAGDMVLVNRMAYHFRKPARGETFVFDTRGINTSGSATPLKDQTGGTHYIKRLCGLPGDTLDIRTPRLYIDGKEAREPEIRRVMAGAAPYNEEGYQSLSFTMNPTAYITNGSTVTLQNNADPNLREYVALGDNTTNSLDSRYWGPVRQFNILGPAAFALWPFTDHWGTID